MKEWMNGMESRGEREEEEEESSSKNNRDHKNCVGSDQGIDPIRSIHPFMKCLKFLSISDVFHLPHGWMEGWMDGRMVGRKTGGGSGRDRSLFFLVLFQE